MQLVFCADPLDLSQPDPAFAHEVQAAQELGAQTSLISFEALAYEGNAEKAVRRVRVDGSVLAMYRGWMLRPERYAALYEALGRRRVQLINDPAAYRQCHYLPESYPLIEGHTPKTVWLRTAGSVSIDEIMELLQRFGERPVIVKDFVKSQKHYWEEACYIPSASDRAAVERVVRRFLELQGDYLEEGLVFREYVELEPLAIHTRSRMPLTQEYRLFWLDGEPVSVLEYWSEGQYGRLTPPVDLFREIAQRTGAASLRWMLPGGRAAAGSSSSWVTDRCPRCRNMSIRGISTALCWPAGA